MIVACPHCRIRMDVTNIAPGTTLLCPSCGGQSIRPKEPVVVQPPVAGLTPPLAPAAVQTTTAAPPPGAPPRPVPPGKPYSGQAIASFVVSLISPFLCMGIISPISLIMGIVSLSRIKHAEVEMGGRGLAIAAVIISIFGVLMVAAIIVAAFLSA